MTKANTREEVALKPCPFCGSRDVFPNGVEPVVFVECEACGCSSGTCHGDTEATAVEAWNRRALLSERDTQDSPARDQPQPDPIRGRTDAQHSAGHWRPIETAPRDGSRVLAYVNGAPERWSYLDGRIFTTWHEGRTSTGYDLGWALYPGFGGVGDEWFTHWMPLPATPMDPLEGQDGQPNDPGMNPNPSPLSQGGKEDQVERPGPRPDDLCADAQERSLWMPMGGAPKDGRRLLVFTPKGAVIARWASGEPGENVAVNKSRRNLYRRHGGYWTAHFAGAQPIKGLPSHWMALPAPPIDQPSEGDQ